MIKLIRPEKPNQLTDDIEKSLTEEFLTTGKAVWRKEYITEKLLEMSHGKCCYCEIKLNVQSREMHVEHFHYKDKYIDEVVKWDNLLPSCRQCNSNKGTLDTKVEQFIDPTIYDPRDFFFIHFFMIKSKDNGRDSIGYRTIEILDLNNRERLVNLRIELADEIEKKLAETNDRLHDYLEDINNTRKKNRILRTIKDILNMAQPNAEFSAFLSTFILNSNDYIEIIKALKDLQLWDDELETLHNNSRLIKYELK